MIEESGVMGAATNSFDFFDDGVRRVAKRDEDSGSVWMGVGGVFIVRGEEKLGFLWVDFCFIKSGRICLIGFTCNQKPKKR